MLGKFFVFLLSSADFFKINIFKKYLSGVSNGLDPDQGRRSVSPGLG